MLSFVEGIKQIIAEVQADGGSTIQHSSVSPVLLHLLREYAAQQLSLKNEQDHLALLDWFNEGLFDEYVRVCAIYLRKLGVTEEAASLNLISKVVDVALTGENALTHRARNYEERLVASLVEVWNQIGDDQTVAYTFAQDRWLRQYVKFCVKKWNGLCLGLHGNASKFQTANHGIEQ